MALQYSFQGFDSKSMVRLAGRNLPLSHKVCYEIAKFIKNKKVGDILKTLERVSEKKTAIPYRRYNRDVAHKPGKIAGARYPIKTSKAIINLLKNLQGAARSKGLDIQKLQVIHAAAHKGPKRHRYGRKRGQERKNTHFELVAKEAEATSRKLPATQQK